MQDNKTANVSTT